MIALLMWILLNQMHPRDFWLNAVFALLASATWWFGGQFGHALVTVALNRGWLP